ncbi:MAG: hypothetical protein WCV68_02880 [Candidatus Paceibacterota bacterium]|jgi:hypothetical protein
MKKIIITILVIAIIVSLGIIGYFVYNQNKTTLPPTTMTTPSPLFPIASTTGGEIINTGSTTISGGPSSAMGVPNRPELSQMSIANIGTVVVGKNLITIFVEKGTGNLYSLDNQNNMARLSNTTLPGIGEAYLGSDTSGWRSILKQEKNGQISTYLGQLKMNSASSTEPSELKTTNWINPLSLAVSPGSSKVAYLEQQKDGSANLYTSDWSIKSSKKVWSSPLTEWSIAWPKDNILTITNKASFDYPGSSYSLNLTTGLSKKVLSDINGLTVKSSPDNQRLVYSKSLLGGVSLYQYDLATGTTRLLDLNTLPDKCVWVDNDIIYCAVPKKIPSGNYPDDWYRGKKVFADDIWRLDLKQKTNTLVYSLKGNYDLNNLIINKQAGWLYALNKADNTLQAFSLKP